MACFQAVKRIGSAKLTGLHHERSQPGGETEQEEWVTEPAAESLNHEEWQAYRGRPLSGDLSRCFQCKLEFRGQGQNGSRCPRIHSDASNTMFKVSEDGNGIEEAF